MCVPSVCPFGLPGQITWTIPEKPGRTRINPDDLEITITYQRAGAPKIRKLLLTRGHEKTGGAAKNYVKSEWAPKQANIAL